MPDAPTGEPARLRRILRAGGLGLLFGALLTPLLVQAYAVVRVAIEREPRLPATFGNFERVRALLPDDGTREEFAFGVVGDPRGTETFEQIVLKLQTEPLAFLVLLGDCVPKATEGDHRFFRTEWAEELRVPFPVFYVVGNHDVDATGFPVSRFEELYGPSNFHFSYRDCLFIVLRVLDKPVGPSTTTESLDYFESVLAERRSRYQRVFVFTHIPPPVSRDILSREYEESARFVRLCDQYRVDYVISGDYHGYARVRLRGTTYLVTGGGGSPLRGRTFGLFHHAIVLRVGPESISERILFMDRQSDLWDAAERLAIAQVHPWMTKNWHLAILLDLAALGACVLLARSCLRRRRRERRGES